MLCKRRLQRLRSCHWQVVVIVVVLFLGVFLAYRTLSGHDAASHLRSYFPTMDQGSSSPKQIHAGSLHSRVSRNQTVDADFRLQEVISLLYPSTWKGARDTDEVAIVLKDKMLDLNLPSPMSCQEILSHQVQRGLSQSRNKFVEVFDFEPPVRPDFGGFGSFYRREEEQRYKRPTMMVMKSQADDIQTKIACMKQTYDSKFCSPMGNYLLMREIFLLRFLRHPGLITVHGYCMRGDTISSDLRKKGLVLVTEMGMPLVPSVLVTFSWSHKVKLAYDAASLLAYLHTSPLGSVGLPHVQQKDFVLVNQKSLKLTDLDEAEIAEKACSSAADCYLQGSDVGVACKEGLCVGLNLRTNLRVIGTYILEPLLKNAPLEAQTAVDEFLRRVRHLDITPKELVTFMGSLARNYSLPGESTAGSNTNNKPYRMAAGQPSEHRNGMEMNANKSPSDIFIRMDSSNFPGKYDYPCPDSRVVWGCVMTYSSLQQVMKRCSADTSCRSFVVFSTKPELDNKMTVVFKSGSDTYPHNNLGTTLFVKKKSTQLDQSQHQQQADSSDNRPWEQGNKQAEGIAGDGGLAAGDGQKEQHDLADDSNQAVWKAQHGQADNSRTTQRKDETGEHNQDSVQQAASKDTERDQKVKEDPWAKVVEVQQCVQHTQDNQQEARRSRERRLMAMMGLKGRKEEEWKRLVKIQRVKDFSHLQVLSEWGLRGGSMLIHFNTSTTGHNLPHAKFVVEEGVKQNHVAMALVYHTDRILGLYHTPPSVEGFLRTPVVKTFSANQTWKAAFGSLTFPDGTLRGMYVAPAPKVVKVTELSLKPLAEMVSEVTPFNRMQKEQLEYVLLWWLGHISNPNNMYHGYKGHLIHLDGDRAFQELTANYDSHFHHCQFPNVVYKMLGCFRCRQAKICHLGQEVVRSLEGSGFKLSSLHIGDLTEQDYPALINSAATRVLDIVERCIQKFGRESVLY